MTPSKSSFGKLQREREKQAKAKAKAEERAARRDERASAPTQEPEPVEDQQALLDQFARLHEDFSAGRIPVEDFESRLDDLRSRLRVD